MRGIEIHKHSLVNDYKNLSIIRFCQSSVQASVKFLGMLHNVATPKIERNLEVTNIRTT